MSQTGPHPESDPFKKLTDEELATRIRAAEAFLSDRELENIVDGDVVPADLPQPDLYGPRDPDELEFREED